MVKINKNDFFQEFMSNFGSSQDNSEKSPMPVKKIRTPLKKVRDGCSHFFLVTHTYNKSEKISPPHKTFFSGLPNFFNGEIVNSQKLREKVPCP